MSEIRVECYSGYTFAQEPRAFEVEGARHFVETIERAWLKPGARCFRVRDLEQHAWVLIYRENEEVWEINSVEDQR
jgi:hypothetical protein